MCIGKGRYYLSVNGYRGQDSHLADSTKALRLMLGVDDNRKDYLRLVPRFPCRLDKAVGVGYPGVDGQQSPKNLVISTNGSRRNRRSAFSWNVPFRTLTFVLDQFRRKRRKSRLF